MLIVGQFLCHVVWTHPFLVMVKQFLCPIVFTCIVLSVVTTGSLSCFLYTFDHVYGELFCLSCCVCATYPVKVETVFFFCPIVFTHHSLSTVREFLCPVVCAHLVLTVV